MMKIEYMTLPSIFVVLLGGMLLAGTANAGGDKVTQNSFNDDSVDGIVAGTQQRISELSEKLQNYQIQAEHERKQAEAVAKAADIRVNQARTEMLRAQKLLEQLSYRQGVSVDLEKDPSVDDIVNETQKQVVQLTVKLQRLQIDAESEKKAAEAKINDVQLKIDQLISEKRRVEALMNQLTVSSSPVSNTNIAAYSRPASMYSGSEFGGQQAMVLDDVQFDRDSAVLKYSAVSKINNIVDYLLKNPARKVLIAGHSDKNGKAGYNLNLSERRAKSVFYALLEKGVPLEQLRVTGFGDTRPRIQKKSRVASKVNRRVEIVVLN